MVKAGDTIKVVETGETFHFLQTAADTDGRLLRIQMYIAPGGGAKAAPMHIHPKSEERFYVQRGKLFAVVNGESRVYEAGEVIIIPAGAAHTWSDGGDGSEWLEFIVEIEPAMQMETLFEMLGETSRLGKLSKEGKAPLLGMIAVLHRYPDNLYMAGLPIFAQKLLFALLAPLARLRGYTGMTLAAHDSAQTKTAEVRKTLA